MRRIITTIITIVAIATVHAEEPRLAFWGGYSYGKEISSTPGNPTEARFHYKDYTSSDIDRNKSAATIGFDYRIFKGLHAGLSWTTGGKLSEAIACKPDQGPILCNYKVNFIMLNSKYEWLKVKRFRFYSRAGIGIGFASKVKLDIPKSFDRYRSFLTITNTRNGCTELAWQVAPLGVEFKPCDYFGIFAEGGFGNQGNLLAGARIYIPQKFLTL